MDKGKAGPRPPVLLRAPLAPAAVLLAGGIAAALAWELPRAIWPVATVLSAVGAILTARRAHLHALTAGLIGLGILAAGGWRADQCYRTTRGDGIVLFTGGGRSLTSLRGRVVSIPQIVQEDLEASVGYRRPPRTHLTLRVQQVLTRDGWRPASGLTSVNIDQADDRLRAGQEVELMGWLARPRGPDNPGQYDWPRALRRQGIATRLSVTGADGATILSAPRGWAARAWWSVRSAGRPSVGPDDDSADQTLLAALVLGDRADSLASLNRIMARSGLAHYLSISGSHLAVLLGMAYLLCRVAGLSPRPSAAVVLAVLAAYLLQAQLRSPLLRSAIQAAALCVGVMLGRRNSVLNSLAVAAIVLLAADPLQLADAGFQLSFGIVAALVLAQRAAKSMLFGRYLARRGLMVFRDDQRMRRWLNFRASDWTMDAAAMALTAYVASAPLVAWHFGFFSPYAAALTLLAFPVVTAVLAPGYLALLLGPLMPNLAYQANRLAADLAGLMSQGARLMARLPLLAVDVRPVDFGWVVLTYAVLAMVLLRRRLGVRRRVPVAAALVWLAATAWTQRPAPRPPVAELDLLAVGGGQCAVLRCPSGRTFLLDAGTRGGFDIYQQVLGPFLRDQRLPKPRWAFVSHANTDHYNALFSYLKENRLGRFYTTSAFLTGQGLSADAAESANTLLGELWGSGAEVLTLQAGRRIELDERTAVEVLWPAADYVPASANDSSLVLRVTCDGRSLLLCGDVESGPQQALLSRPEGLACDVLVLPHHGGWKKTLPGFVRAADPKFILASNNVDLCAAVRSDADAQRFYTELANSGRFRCTARNGWTHVRFGRGVLEAASAR
jgi:competence protein ComEC